MMAKKMIGLRSEVNNLIGNTIALTLTPLARLVGVRRTVKKPIDQALTQIRTRESFTRYVVKNEESPLRPEQLNPRSTALDPT